MRYTILIKWAGIGVFFLALLLLSWALISDRQSFLLRYWARYCSYLERKLRLMFIFTPGRYIAFGQLAAVFVVIATHLAVNVPAWFLVVALILGIPPWYIERMRQKRVLAIESQFDGFLTALANALKATPSVSNSFVSVQPLLPSPLREEVELAVKEMRVGSTLDQSLLNMGGRIASRQVDSGLSAVLIGRQLGGDLPKILETTAHSLREMIRLEGVVQSKTAEGKSQMWLLGLFPFFFALVLNGLQPGFFDPLKEPVWGWVIAGVAGIFWLGSVLWSRAILSVDI
jgi:tight adherence protein B